MYVCMYVNNARQAEEKEKQDRTSNAKYTWVR